MKCKIGIVILLFGMLAVCAAAQHQSKGVSVSKVVIDAGHGGKDPGAVYKNLKEKDINLAVALRLGKLINEGCPGVEVIYTRKTDVFVDLGKRGDIANKAGADLFISIHTNAKDGKAPSGTETFVMGVHKGESNLEVAMRENDVIAYESDYSTKYQGYEPGSAESFIIFSLMQYAYLEQSLQFADIVQQHFGKNISIPNRGVQQAGFLVLWRTAMPSVLTELGFINNAKDNGLLASEKGRDAYAKALFDAFCAYKEKVEGKAALTSLGGRSDGSETAAASGKDYFFAVQVSASKTKSSPDSPAFRGLPERVYEHREDNMYRCYVGRCNTHAEALALQAQVRKKIDGAFVVALRDGKRIPITEQMKKDK